MKAQEIENWAREIIKSVLANNRVEDSRVELKSIWEPEKAAPRLAAHANAARGESILWLIGVDEKRNLLTDVDPVELESWYKAVQRSFDGFAPRLLVDVNIRVEDKTVVALYFETEKESPYVVKSPKGGYPEYIVPWREGTHLRAARREDLLLILVPIRRLSALLDELEYNITVAQVASTGGYNAWGCPFREEEFHRAIRDGSLITLAMEARRTVSEAYVTMGRANQRTTGALNTSMGGSAGADKSNEARVSVTSSLAKIEEAYSALRNALREVDNNAASTD